MSEDKMSKKEDKGFSPKQGESLSDHLSEHKTDHRRSNKRREESHEFPFSLLKGSLIGSIVGALVIVFNSHMQQKSNVRNKYISLLPEGLAEGMDDEVDLCQWFVLLNKGFRNLNPKTKRLCDLALEKCSDLCFLSESVYGGLLNKCSEKLANRTMDVLDIDIDDTAKHLWSDMRDALDALYLNIQALENAKFLKRDALEKKYAEEKAAYDIDLVDWQKEKLEHDALKSSAMMSIFNVGVKEQEQEEKKDIIKKELRPQPIPPKVPEETALRLQCDMADTYIQNILGRTREICIYVSKSVEKFRKEYYRNRPSRPRK